MNQPPEVLDAGEEFEIISEVQPLCATDELPRVPAFERPSLVDSVPLFGLLLVAKGGTLVVKKSRTVLSGSPGGEGSEVWCGGRITHITHACDGLTIFVITIWGDDCPHLLCFDTAGLVQQGSSASPYLECSNSSSAGSRVLGLAVNPTDPACVAYCTSTGDLTVLNISTNSVTYNTKKNMGARAIGWSAKGKQMCVGCQDGSLSLHKPDLAPVRIIAAPPLFAGAAAPVTALVWFTNTEFFVAYQQSNNQPCLVYVNGPKGQPAQYINYEDVCYSNDSPEPLFYHLLFIPQWNQLLVLSSGGIEMATLIKTSSGAWAQLALEEGSRAEMHFINVTQETFPLGITLDLCSTKTFTVKEDVTEGPHPVVVSLSTGGELNIFHLVNRLPDKPDLRASLPAQPAPAGPVRTAQQYCSNIVIPPRPHASSALSSAVDAGLPGTSSSAGVASSGFAFSSNFTNPSSVAGFTATSSTAIASAPATNYSSSFASTNTFAAPGTTSSSSANFLSGIGTIVSASTTNASSTLFQTSNTTSASGSLGLFSRPSVPPSNGSSLFGGASMFSQNKAPTSSLFGGGVSLGGSVSVTSPAVAGPSPTSAPAAAFSFAGGSSAFSVPAQSAGAGSLFKAPPATAPSPTSVPDAVNPPAESPRPAGGADGTVAAAARTQPVGSNYRAPASPALQGTQSVSSNRASPSAGEQQQQLATTGGRSARSAAQEAALIAQALKEQDLFEVELRDHRVFCERMEYKGGWKTSLEVIQGDIQKQQALLDLQKQQVGDLSEGMTNLHEDLLEFYSSFEATKAAVLQLKEPKCNQLSEWHGLPRSSERQLQQLWDQVHYIQRELSYASAALDSLPDRQGHPASHSRSGTTTVYRAAQLGRTARVSCEQRLDELSTKLKQLSVCGDLALPKKDKKTTKTGRYGISEESLLVEEKENLSTDMTKDKQQQLWAILQRRGHTPVRKSGKAVLSPYAVKSGSSPQQRQPGQLHEPSFLSLSFGPGKCSTPNVPEVAPKQTPDSSAAVKRGLSDTPKSSWQNSSLSTVRSTNIKVEPAENVAPKYEDITPPGTPEVDTRGQENNRTVSSHPLSALSSLVGKVPPTAAVGVLPQGSLAHPPDTPKSSNTGFSFGAFVPPKSELKFVTNSEKDGLTFFAASSSGFSSNLSTGTSTIMTTASMLFSTGISVTSSATPGVASRLFSSSNSGSIFGSTLVQPGVPTALLAAGSSSSGGFSAGLDLTTATATSPRSSESAITNSDFFTKGSVTITPVNKPTFSADRPTGSEIGNISITAVQVEDGSNKATASGLGASETNSSSVAIVPPKQGLISVVSPSGLFPTTSTTLFGSQTPASTNSSVSVVQSTGTNTSAATNLTVLPTSEVHEAPSSSLFGTAKTSSSIFAASGRAVISSTENLKAAPGSAVSSSFTSANSVFAVGALGLVSGANTTAVGLPVQVDRSTGTATSTFGSPAVLGTEASSGNSVLSFTTKTSGLPGASLFATPASTSASLFATSTPSISIFATPASSSSTFAITGSSSGTVFSTTSNTTSASSVFGTTVSSSLAFGTSISSSGSMFGASVPPNSVFGAPVSSSSVFENPVSSSSSMFGNPVSSSSSVFINPVSSSSSVFGNPVSSSSSVFGNPVSSSSSVFGNPVSSSSSVFGNPVSSSSSVFGNPVSSSSSIFGNPVSSSSSVFGNPVSSSSSVFGIQASSSSSAFGTPACSSSSVFGTPATSTSSLFGSLSSSGSVFGPPAFSSAGSVFGAPASTAASVFGSAPPSGSLFASPAASSASSFGNSGSVFGAPTSSTGSVFGTSSGFGTTAASTQSSVFGASSAFGTTLTQGAGGTGSAFGSSTLFGSGAAAAAAAAPTSSASIFGGAAPAATSSASVFGGAGQAGVFGSSSGNSVFGGDAAAFGSPSSSSVFGGAAGAAGGSSSSLFGDGAILTGLGSAAPTNSTNKNIFGISGSAVKPQTDLFSGSGSGTATVSSASSLFGGSSSNALNQPSSAFGAAPAFGSPPKFGSAPAFGSPPAFGSSVFGGAAPSAPGSSGGGGFSSFANSSGTATFGGIAATGTSNSSFGTGASSPFSSGNLGGGSSFTSWR